MISWIPHKILLFRQKQRQKKNSLLRCSQNPNSPLTWIGSSLKLGFCSFLGFTSLVQVLFSSLLLYPFLLFFYFVLNSWFVSGDCRWKKKKKVWIRWIPCCGCVSNALLDLSWVSWEVLKKKEKKRFCVGNFLKKISNCGGGFGFVRCYCNAPTPYHIILSTVALSLSRL